MGGYFELEAHDRPTTLIVGGSLAIVSAISIFFLTDEPRTLFDRVPGGWQPTTRRGHAELVAAIRRTKCFGHCPAYSVAIYRDGVVEYDGEANVRTKGRVVGRISTARLDALEAHIVRAGFPAFRKRYEEQHCTDHPMVYTWYRPVGRSTKSVAHYLGDRSAPGALIALEEHIDTVVDVEQWTGAGPNQRGPVATYCR